MADKSVNRFGKGRISPDNQSRQQISNSACGLVGYFCLVWLSGVIRHAPYRLSEGNRHLSINLIYVKYARYKWQLWRQKQTDVCLSVRYRFSRQPLNRLFWNFAWCFEMISERQLSILVPNGCIINELSHKLCIIKQPRMASKPKLRRHTARTSWFLIWRQIMEWSWCKQPGVNRQKHWPKRDKTCRRATSDRRRVAGNGPQATGEGRGATGDGR